MQYAEFLATKKIEARKTGIKNIPDLNASMFPYQKDVTEFLLECGKGAAFLDTGLGKSLCALDYGRVVNHHLNKPVLMLAPLAVGPQHEREAVKFDIATNVKYIRSPDQLINGINITNYENVHNFNPSDFGGVILDESSIIKSFTGATTRKMMDLFNATDFKLACTATPSPNDHMELGQHSQFLDVMDSSEMLARFFMADQSEMGRYRIKKYAVKDFWSWVASWSRCLSKPSDLGYSDDGFTLPELITKHYRVDVDITENAQEGMLMRIPDTSATAIHGEKRLTIKQRADKVRDIIDQNGDDYAVIWCDTDYEAEAIMKAVPQAVEVSGSMKTEEKEARLDSFQRGETQILLTKPRIGGFGLNFQHCNQTIFAGLSFSYEQYYQAVRRFHRFGQKRQVTSHVVMSDTEASIWQIVSRKMKDHENMKREMAEAMKREVLHKGVKNMYSGSMKPTIPAFLKG